MISNPIIMFPIGNYEKLWKTRTKVAHDNVSQGCNEFIRYKSTKKIMKPRKSIKVTFKVILNFMKNLCLKKNEKMLALIKKNHENWFINKCARNDLAKRSEGVFCGT